MIPLTVVMTTWAPDCDIGESRIISTQVTLASWAEYLKYDGPLRLHIADDGSQFPRFPRQMLTAPRGWDSITFSRQERHGVGASLNAGFAAAFEHSPLVAYFVDDWALHAPLDLTPWARILIEDVSVGVVRLGPPHPDITGKVEHRGELPWTLRLDRHHYAFGHRPALYHQRMIDTYGWFTEDVNAMDCERVYNERFCTMPSVSGRYSSTSANGQNWPGVVLALPHSWDHVGEAEVGYVVPGEVPV